MTSDSGGTVQAWHGETGAMLASYPTGASRCTLLTLSLDADSFLMVKYSALTVRDVTIHQESIPHY